MEVKKLQSRVLYQSSSTMESITSRLVLLMPLLNSPTLNPYMAVRLQFESTTSAGLEILINSSSLGSPWGAGTLAGPKGPDGESRQPSEIELSMAEKQGKAFWETVSRVSF